MHATKQTANQLRDLLQNALRDRYGNDNTWVWVDDFDPEQGWVVFEVAPDDAATTLWRTGYSADGEAVTLGDARVEVVRTVDYATKTAAELTGPIVRKDTRRRIAVAPVLVPGEPDADGETLTAEKIEDAAHAWLEQYRALDADHDLSVIDARPVESYLEPVERTVTLDDGAVMTIPAGTWTMAVKVHDTVTWSRIESGELGGFSIMAVPRSQLELALSALKSGGTAGLRRTTLADVGGGDSNGDWVAPLVSIVARPAVPKSKWLALKAGPPQLSATDEPGLFRRFADWLTEPQATGKQGATAPEPTKEVDPMDPKVQEAIRGAVKEALEEQNKPSPEEQLTAVIDARVGEVLDDKLKPIVDAFAAKGTADVELPEEVAAVIEALPEEHRGPVRDAFTGALKAATGSDPDDPDGGDGDLPKSVKAAIDAIGAKVDGLDARTRPASLQPAATAPGGPDPALKGAPTRDAHGRAV